MNVESNAKKRRVERIRELLGSESSPERPAPSEAPHHEHERKMHDKTLPPSPWQTEERDPELLWKQGRGLWREEGVLSPGKPPFPSEPVSGGSFFRTLLVRTLASAVVFGILWGIHRYQPPWSSPIRSFVADSLNKEMDFQAVEAWYERNFGGAPSFIPIFGRKDEPQQLVQSSRGFTAPVQGTLAEGFAVSLKGVEIMPDQDSSGSQEIKCVETGRVTDVSNDALTGRTVVVQHSGGYVSVYGRLSEVSVTKGDWLEGGETVGSIYTGKSSGSDTLYFAMKKDGLYLDPSEVVPLD
ncbi:M23 family metallopeptidase [Paenibacillus caui]|uniref:M23 family metallopeptidase n=1 Tax=Paenibacillus caui TaxID=2873927 RepID=UPI001F39F7F2|nr:M23 family metallopeptidase [Paenibacillus caui]